MRTGVIAWLAAGLLAAAAEPGGEEAIIARLQAGDDAEAAALLDEHLAAHPGDAVMLYNAACVRCRLGRTDEGARFLLRSIKAGFADFGHLRRDPDLRGLRGHAVYRAIVDAREAADEMLAARQLERWRGLLPAESCRFEADTRRRINYVTCLDESAHAEAARTLEALERHLQDALFAGLDRGWVLVAIPEPDDAVRLLARDSVQGHYSHLRRELVAADPQRALRHEFVHALHNAHMDALGQDHALWIQEGLATLYEDYETGDTGTIRFLANDREQLVAVLARRGELLPWREIARLAPEDLRADGAAIYAQLRSILGWIENTAGLAAWYRACTETFDADPSGLAALEAALGAPVDECERRWRLGLDAATIP
jgi:hypothetical protein